MVDNERTNIGRPVPASAGEIETPRDPRDFSPTGHFLERFSDDTAADRRRGAHRRSRRT